MSNVLSPRDLGLPHEDWRPHQWAAIQKIRSLKDEGGVLIIQAPAGSGKSALAAAMGAEERVMALSSTKILQKENYGDTYDFSYLFGKGNYPCACAMSANGVTASLCPYASPRSCREFDNCPYYTERRETRRAQKVALNYAYYLSTHWPREEAPWGYLFLDECHLLSRLVIHHCSVTLGKDDRRRWGLPDFPQITNRGSSILFRGKPEDEALSWLNRAGETIDGWVGELEREAILHIENMGVRRRLGRARNLAFRLKHARDSLSESSEDWFIRSGRSGKETRREKVPGFTCRPLSARHHFPRRFLLEGPTILMSATVGDSHQFTSELGIDDYDLLRIPPRWPSSKRPIYYCENAPEIGYETTVAEKEKQADLIVEVLGEVPESWSGVIHCKSRAQVNQLASRLAERGLEDRIWVPPSISTERQMMAWRVAKESHPGRLAVAWCWWVGVDLLDERIVIVAKVPFGYLGSDYGRARLQYDEEMYLQRTAWRLQQGCGRTRRGRSQDYDQDRHKAGLVAILDANWKQVRSYLDDDFEESLKAWP